MKDATIKAHKHAELIKAWADGATIQYMSTISGNWINSENNEPPWYDNVEYRVKPVPKPDYSKFVGLYKADGYHDTSGVYGDESNIPKFSEKDSEFFIVNKLELVFDGETGQLKNVVIHNKD